MVNKHSQVKTGKCNIFKIIRINRHKCFLYRKLNSGTINRPLIVPESPNKLYKHRVETDTLVHNSMHFINNLRYNTSNEYLTEKY